jgi:hypothetical protein
VDFFIRHHNSGFYLPYHGSNGHAVKSAKVSESIDHRIRSIVGGKHG